MKFFPATRLNGIQPVPKGWNRNATINNAIVSIEMAQQTINNEIQTLRSMLLEEEYGG